MSLICYLKIDLYCIVSIAYNETFYKITEWDEKKNQNSLFNTKDLYLHKLCPQNKYFLL